MIFLSASPYLGHIITTEIIVWGICIGSILAFTLYFLQVRIFGSLVGRLINDAVGEENAKTLAQIGKNNAFYRHFLRDNSILRKTVILKGDALPRDEEGRAIFDTAEFYIAEQGVDEATRKYLKETKIWIYVLGVVLCLLVGLGMHFLLPYILNMLP